MYLKMFTVYKLSSISLISLCWGCCLTCPGGKLCTLGPGGRRKVYSSVWPREHRDKGREKHPRSGEHKSGLWDIVSNLWLTSFTWSAAATSLKLQSKSFARISPTRNGSYLFELANNVKLSPSSDETCLRCTMSPLFPSNTSGTSLFWLLFTS